jgi:hypothetical protein
MPWGLWSSPPRPAPPGGGKGDETPTSSQSQTSATSQPPPSSTSPSPSPDQAERATDTSITSLFSSPKSVLTAAIESITGQKQAQALSWNDSLNKTDWKHYKEPRNWLPPALAVAAALGILQFYRSYLRRFPGTVHIAPGFFRRRSLFGRVTSVGDGDNFHLFHTPGGRLAGWGWLRRVPKDKKVLRGRTVSLYVVRHWLC